MESLKELQAKVQRRQKLQAEIDSLRERIATVVRKGVDLSVALEKEQADVERLTKAGITALFYAMLGKKEEMLEKERREFYAAAAKYEAAKTEHRQLEAELRELEEEFASLHGCEARYEQALQTRIETMKREDPVNGRTVVELEAQIERLRNRRKELREAINAGSAALAMAHSVQSELDSAEDWGTWDMLGGSGLITQMAKHDHLEEAQHKVQQLQRQLHRFKTELSDVEIRVDVQAKIDGFLGFADWFFDGLFVDWAVQEKIHEAQDKMSRTVHRIEQTLEHLRGLDNRAGTELEAFQKQLELLAVSSDLQADSNAGAIRCN